MSTTLYHEIVSILCYTAPLVDTVLLTKLQAKYPSSGWTLDLVDTYLAAGKSKGLFSSVGSYAGGPVTGWQLNKKALSLNYAFNVQFAPYCAAFTGVPCCSATTQGLRDSDT